ncbi:unnamed protein product [Euphydryas editha]|uniref:Secreted protein n=1 Tax=Euphydryas editha TaxID=104508 RepID=A0AAU9U4V1_EUPED|nr:unnamed protein product [Euphydryas editha]
MPWFAFRRSLLHSTRSLAPPMVRALALLHNFNPLLTWAPGRSSFKDRYVKALSFDIVFRPGGVRHGHITSGVALGAYPLRHGPRDWKAVMSMPIVRQHRVLH